MSDDDDKPFIVFGAPLIKQDEIDEVVAVLKSGWLGTGPRVATFEREFAEYKGAPHSAAVNSCTAALHLSMLMCQLEPGDEVITTPMTFVSTVNSIVHAGGTPVLADVDQSTMNIDPACVRDKISERTKVILPVHFAGRPCEMGEIMALADEHDIRVVEDCAHAVETEYEGRKIGTIGDYGCFSFYANKNLATGEGGMLLPRSGEDLERIKRLSLHGLDSDAWKRFSASGYCHYDVAEPGYKYNMMDLQAALGIHQLRRIEANWIRRQDVWQRYMSAFADLPIGLPPEPAPNTRHAYHLFTVMVDEARTGIARDAFLIEMKRRGIGVGVHYLSMTERSYYQDRLGWRPEDCPNALTVGRQTASLPLTAKLSGDEVTRVIAAVRDVLK